MLTRLRTRSILKIKGFTLMELLLVVAIMMGLGVLQFQKMKTEAEEAAASQAAREHTALVEAMQIYVIKNMSRYQQMTSIPDCVPVDAMTCKLDLNILVREGLLNSGWAPFNRAIKTGYSGYIKRVLPASAPPASSGPLPPSEYDVEAMVRTDDPWTVGGGSSIAYAMLGSAVKQAGPSAGLVRAGKTEGLFGAWTMDSAKYPGLADGQLVGVVKINASALSQFVRLDGSLAMTGSLNMGNNRINNARDMQLLGPSSLPRKGGAVTPMVSDLASNWVLKNVYNVSDFDSDNTVGSVPRPTCADADASNGVPKILLKMNAMYNEMYGGMSYGEPVQPSDSQLAMMKKQISAYGGWNFYALEDTGSNLWRVYIRRFYDNGYIPGEGLAEVYCYYP